MKHEDYKKYLYAGVTMLSVVVASITFFFILFKFHLLLSFLGTFRAACMPFVYGFIFAYLLTPLFNYFHRKLTRLFHRFSHAKQISKMCSTLLTMVIAFLLLAGLLYLVLPQIITTIADLLDRDVLQTGLNELLAWLQASLARHPQIEGTAMDLYRQAAHALTVWMQNDMLPQLNSVMAGVLGTLTVAKDLIISIFITIYVLNSKETFAAQSKKLIYSIFSIPHANLIVHNTRFVHQTFGGFINGKLIDSLILGIAAFIGMTLLRLPYAMLISVIVGIAEIIPFFGPFIGAIPSTLLILMVSPVKAIYFLIFIFILEQINGNLVSPKILGSSTGLSSFWVLFAILVFGGMFGVLGWILGVPMFAVLYSAIKSLIGRSLKRRRMSSDTHDYQGLDHVRPDDGSMCYEGEKPTSMQTAAVRSTPPCGCAQPVEHTSENDTEDPKT